MTVVLRVVLKEAEEVIRTATVSPFETVPELAQAPPFIRIDGDPSPLTLTGTEVLRPEIVTGLKVTSVLGWAEVRFSEVLNANAFGVVSCAVVVTEKLRVTVPTVTSPVMVAPSVDELVMRTCRVCPFPIGPEVEVKAPPLME